MILKEMLMETVFLIATLQILKINYFNLLLLYQTNLNLKIFITFNMVSPSLIFFFLRNRRNEQLRTKIYRNDFRFVLFYFTRTLPFTGYFNKYWKKFKIIVQRTFYFSE